MGPKIINLDPAAFGLRICDWQIEVQGQSAGEGVSGDGQVVYGNQPRWVAELQFVPGFAGTVVPWRVIMAQVRGRINVLRLRLRDPYRPRLSDTGLILDGTVTHSDGTAFGDGTGYGQGIAAPVMAAAAAGATTILVDGGYLGNIDVVGRMISIDDWAYLVVGMEGSGSATALTIEMPLRRAVTLGMEANFDGCGLFRLDADTGGALSINESRAAAPQLRIREWVGVGRP